MTLWTAIVLACAATYLTKLAGYAVPARSAGWPGGSRRCAASAD